MNYSNLTAEQQMVAEAKKFVNKKHRELTQAEYDALSVEEKNNGTVYFVTDSENPSVDTYTKSEIDVLFDNKVDKAQGKGLSTNDYTNAEKQKLANIESNAQANVQSDWNEDDTEDDGYIKNKPDLSTSLTATGNPITIESSESNLVECVAEVEAEQDLHGYDHPWVGGAGKNKLSSTAGTVTKTGVTYTMSDNQKLTVSGIATGNSDYIINLVTPISITAGQTIYFQMMNSTGTATNAGVWLNEYETMIGYFTATNKVLSYTATSDITISKMTYRHFKSDTNNNYTANLSLSIDEELTTFEPYSNICPITGQTEVVIDDVGKNKFDASVFADATSSFKAISITLKANTTYTMSGDKAKVNGNSEVFFYITGSPSESNNSVSNGISRTLTTGTDGIVQIAYRQYDASLTSYHWQIEEGSTATTYEPFAGKTYTIQIGDTIYGGELDVLTGKLRVTHGYAEFDGSSDENWRLSAGRYRVISTLIKDIVKRPTSGTTTDIFLISNSFKQYSARDLYLGKEEGIGIEFDTGNFCAHYGGLYVTMTLNDWTTYLASNPLQVVYELATPFTIQLTPQQIRLLKGTNNISCNTGDLSIKYYPDNVLGQLKGDIESEYDARLERLEQYTDVFGFIEDMDVLSPTERIKYIGKNENYEPLTVDLNTGSYTLGDWGNFPFLVDNKPYMVKPDGTPDYQLNEYDYTKKLDGTDSDVANEDYDGGAFSWGRKIYKKQWMVGNKRYVLYSFDKKDGFHADGFINKDGKELDGRWIPMFYGTVVDGKAKSIATGNCISGGNITTDAQHNAIIAFDSNANFFGGAFVETLIDLLMMFAKNSDLQAAYGYGNSSGYVNDSSKNYGMLNNAVVNGGQFYGRSGGKTLNKALHSIVLATYNSYMRDPYEVIKNGKVVVSEDYTYDPTGATYTDTGITVPNQSSNAWRYPKKYIAVPRYGSIPDISVGGASTSLGRTDGTYTLANQSGAVIVCLRFGDCDCGAIAGLSCRHWHYTASNSGWNVGFALLLDGSVVA